MLDCCLLLTIFLASLGMPPAYGATLSVVLSGSGQGTVNSAPAGIVCPGTCSAALTNFILYANPGSNSCFSGWGDACAGLETCALDLTGDATVTAFFDLKSSLVRVSGSNYGGMQVAYNSVAPGGKVQVVAKDQPGDLNLDKKVNFSLEGGFNDAFSSNAGNVTRLNGTLIVRDGSLTVAGLAVAQSVPAPPAAPSGVIVAANDDQVTISWDEVLGATSYNLYYSTTAGVGRTNGIKISGATSGQPLPGLTNGTTYYFVVTAVGPNGESNESAQVIFTPPVPAGSPVPLGVTASAGNGQLKIIWNSVVGATSYNIYWSTSPGVTKTNGTQISGIAASPYQHTGLTNGTTYYYIVTANMGTEESAPSAEASSKPTAAVALKITKVTIYNGTGQLIGYTTTEYNANGRISKVIIFGSTGEISNYMLYEYNGDGKPVKISTYIITGYLIGYTTTEYDSDGRVVRTASFGPMSTPLASTVTEYDADGNVSRTTNLGATGLITTFTLYQYNAAGDTTRESNFDFAGNSMGYTTTEYNADGKKIKSSTYGPTGLLEKYVTTDYNGAGKVVKVTTYNGFTNMMTEFTMYEYDGAGNRTKVSNYDFAGLLTGYTTTEYNASKLPVMISIYGPTGLLKKYTIMEYGN